MNKYPLTLILGDFHINEKRLNAFYTGIKDAIGKAKKVHKEYDKVILLGDLFDKTPTVKERLVFVKVLKNLKKFCKEVTIISGTDGHDFTREGLYNIQDIIELTDTKVVDKYEIEEYIFMHKEMYGTIYITGHASKSTLKPDKDKTYVLGHIHSPECSYDNVNYLGSIYKTSFAEINDQKRIGIINTEGELEYTTIISLPMIHYTIKSEGNEVLTGAVGIPTIPEDFDKTDVKISVEMTSSHLMEVTECINKIKKEQNIEYFILDRKITELKVSDTVFLEKDKALETYCEEKKVNYKLVKKEL